MRPRHLVVEGFAAFRDRAELDFDGVDFFALVGPTGSGKSSVIDAICFALYGSVPRYDNRVVAPLVTMGSLEARVMLEFSVGEERYLATRVVRRSSRGTGASTREARLEHLTGDAVEVLAGNADELTAGVARLLGLSYEYFTRCVVLPQGAFARFLHDTPGDRQGLLRSLLDIDIYLRIGQTARRAAEIDRAAIAMGLQHLDRLKDASPEALAAAETRVARLEELVVAVRRTDEDLVRLEATIDAETAAARVAGEMAIRLGRISLPASVESAAEEQGRLREAVADAETTLAAAVRRRQELEGAELPDLAGLEAAERAHLALAGLADDLAASSSRLTAASSALEVATGEMALATGAAERAAAALEEARRQHSAAHLAAGLVPGEPCPVCSQPVKKLPAPMPAAAIDEAAEIVAAADEELRACGHALTARANDVAGAEATHQSLQLRQEQLRREIEDYPQADVVSSGVAAIRRHLADLESARRSEDAARKVHNELQRAADEAAAGLALAWSVFDEQRDPVAALAPPAAGRADVQADWSALIAWARKELTEQEALASRAEEAAEAAVAERRQRLGQLSRGCMDAGLEVSGDTSVADIRDAIAKTLAEATADRLLIAQDIGKAELLRADIAALTERQAVSDMLANHLKATGFERWLVAEAMDLLVLSASETL
ncbi:MAG TPA: SMC family ATPase, partial [Acidimicrobiales bacterium]|nr:SMC family ATPase [Acidimicrobiales bacterium]